MIEHKEEGGVDARFKRYSQNRDIIYGGVVGMGFKPFLPKELQGPIISTFLAPKDPNWNFRKLYDELNDQNLVRLLACLLSRLLASSAVLKSCVFIIIIFFFFQVIYPGKTTKLDSFRIGHIGHLFPHNCEHLLIILNKIVKKMGLKMLY